jgi:hypothetical protein
MGDVKLENPPERRSEGKFFAGPGSSALQWRNGVRSAQDSPSTNDAELAILRVLWERGPGTVREILDGVNTARPEPFAYTTVLRFLEIMTEKRARGPRGG